MHQFHFAARNILDKLKKVARGRASADFYLRTYVLSRLDRVKPDVYLVSYPKCGRTWLRVLLLKYTELLGEQARKFNDAGLIALSDELTVKFEHDQGTWVPAPPRLKQLSFNRDKYQGQRVIFLVRDPRDVLVSSWYHLTYRENIYAAGLSAFVRDELVGIEKVVAFMNMWLENRDVPQDFLLMMYEDLHRAPSDSFAQILAFMGIEPDPSILQRAIEQSAFDNMKKMETSGSLKEPWMRPGVRNLDKSLKIRKGKVGGFRQELAAEDIAYVDDVLRRRLTPHLPYAAPASDTPA